jgi:hypothetical protein
VVVGGVLCAKENLEVYQLALRMAGSGKFKDWKGIRDSLVEKCYRWAPDLLDGDKVRTILGPHCFESQKEIAKGVKP